MLAMVTPKCAEAGVKDLAYMHVAGPMVHRCVCAWMREVIKNSIF